MNKEISTEEVVDIIVENIGRFRIANHEIYGRAELFLSNVEKARGTEQVPETNLFSMEEVADMVRNIGFTFDLYKAVIDVLAEKLEVEGEVKMARPSDNA